MTTKKTHVSIAGMGLIGGSLGLALRRAGGYHVTGWNRNRATLRLAKKRGVLDVAVDSLRKMAAQADILVLGVPVPAMEKILLEIAPALKRGAIVTDVGSVKAPAEKMARRALRGRRDVSFVGGHPIAGSEKSGIDAAQKNLFHGAVCVLTSGSPAARRRVAAMWRVVGARPISLSAERHDRFLALTSHLPHAIAFALTRVAAREMARHPELRQVIGPSFRDVTRIAAASADLWSGIFSLNRRPTAHNGRRFVYEMNRLLRARPAAIRRFVSDAARDRRSW